MPVKNSATKKTPVTKKTPARKAAKKAARKAASNVSKPKASDLIKQSSHTPAIFKTTTKRPTHIHYSLEDVREVLKKRAEEEKNEAKLAQKAKKKAAVKKVAVQELAISTTPAQKSKHHAASLDDILGLSPSIGVVKSGPGKVPKKYAKYHRLLIELRDHVRAELNLHSSDTLKRSQKEDAGDISTSIDAGTDNFDRDFALSLLSTEQESLKEIEAAISRIYNGQYGICEVTGEPIKPERLEAVPFTRFSLEGQRQHESIFRKRVSRAGAFLNEGSGEAISFGDDDDN
jgi:DnaK suppressor protein